MNAEMNTKIINDLFGIMGFARKIRAREFGPETRRIDQSARGHMIGMRVLPVRSEKKARTQFTQDTGQASAGLKRRFQPPIGQTEIAAPGQSKHGGGRFGFPLADFRASKRRRLAVG